MWRRPRTLDRFPLPVNAGHAAALDSSPSSAARTEYFVVLLTVDDFPIAPGWLDLVLEPLRNGATIAGAHVHPGRTPIHAGWAMRGERFLRESHQPFKPNRPWDVELLGSERWDVVRAALDCRRERAVPPT